MLTERECEVIFALLQLCNRRKAATYLQMSAPTLKIHLASIFDKNGRGSVLELFAWARGEDII